MWSTHPKISKYSHWHPVRFAAQIMEGEVVTMDVEIEMGRNASAKR